MKPIGFLFFKIPRPFFCLFLSMVILSVLASACGPNKKYAGPVLPDNEIAVIKPGDKMFTHVSILSVDKIRLYTNESSVSVQPGTHTVFIEAVLDYPFLDSDLYFNQFLTFDAEAGQEYTINVTILPMEKQGFSWVTSDRDPETFIVKKYAVDLIPLPSSD
jgi:hypothetical protein